ncbi:MAG: hypothetical protein M3331_02865 [Actinomycetota bacterium]|nr:hypothetical protein [Actinomycetota bacterium]
MTRFATTRSALPAGWGADEVLAIGITEPGLAQTLSVERLKADSVYKLWCSLEGHAEAGMKAKITSGARRR